MEPVHTVAISDPPACIWRSHSTSRAKRPWGGASIGVYLSHTITTSARSTSSMAACGSTGTLPKQRNGSVLAATMRTSSRASPGSPVVMSGNTAPTDIRTSYNP